MRTTTKIWIIIILAGFGFKTFMVIANQSIYQNEAWSGGTVYLIPATHSDPYWKGEWGGSNIGILHDNIIDALLYLRIDPDFRYTIDQAGIVSTFVMEHPEYRNELANAIKQGQIEVAGGGVSQADLNIPSGEGLLRNFLIGNDWFRKEFNISIQVAWQVDTFGATGSFPSLLAAMDYKFLYYMRDSRGYPTGAFWWVGPDGSKILCWKTYYGRYPLTAPDLVAMMYNIIQDPMASIFSPGKIMLHIGGDKVAPHTSLMDYIESWNAFYAHKSGWRAKVATPSEFFNDIKDEASSLPQVGFGQDLNPYNEGALLANIETKRISRLWETSANTAEIFSTLGRNILNISSIQTPVEFDSGWWLNAFFYHHDTITGTCPDEIIQCILNDYRTQKFRAQKVLDDSLSSFAKNVNFNSDNSGLVVFNSESNNRSEIIEANLAFNYSIFPEFNLGILNTSKINIEINDSKSNQLMPVQVISIENLTDSIGLMKVAFSATIESVGYHTFTYNFTYDKPIISYNGNDWENNSDSIIIRNGIYNITWDMTRGGDIVSLIFDGNEQIPAGGTIGFNYADTSNDLYDAPIYDILGQTKDSTATYWLEPGKLLSKIHISVPTPFYFFEITYCIRANSSLIEVSINYQNREDNGAIGNLLMANWDWDDDSATWICGAPYGWTDHTPDTFWDRPFPATYWSSLESSSKGLAVYDRGNPGRSWRPNSNQVSLMLIQQNDPYEGPGSNDPRAAKEKREFFYDELENYTLEFAFEYFKPSWLNASVPQHGRNFNHPLYVANLYNESEDFISALSPFTDLYNLKLVKSNHITPLPSWGSFFQSNSSNVILTAFKPAEAENSLVFRLFSYPYPDSNTENIQLKFGENLLFENEMSDVYLVSALERSFGIDPADSSIQSIQKEFAFESIDQSITIQKEVLKERVVRTMLIPIVNSDVMAPIIKWDTNLFGMIGFPLNIQLVITESSNFTIFGIYSEDSGVTWKNLPEFGIEKISNGEYKAKTTIRPHYHGKLRVIITVIDSYGNLAQNAFLNTTYRHKNTDYGKVNLSFYNTYQIRIIWPSYLIVGFCISIIFFLWLLIHHRDLREINSKVNKKSSIINKFKEFVNKFQAKIGIIGKYCLITFAILFIFNFLYQTLFVYDYNDISMITMLDEYLLDHVTFLRHNSLFMPIYLFVTMGFVFMTTMILKYKYKKQMPAWFGLCIFSIPFLVGIIQLGFHYIFGSSSLLPAWFPWYEMLHLYTNPLMLVFHLVGIFAGVFTPRIFGRKETDPVIKQIKTAIQTRANKLILKKVFLTLWIIGSFIFQILVLSYFSTKVFLDYFTHYLGGMVFGDLSRSQCYQIWAYYAFLIIFYALFSILGVLIHEFVPKNMKNPWRLYNKFRIIFISQAISIIIAYLYFSMSMQTTHWVINVEADAFILYFPAIFFSRDTLILFSAFVAIPHALIYLILYPIKKLFEIIRKKMVYKFRKRNYPK